MEREILSLLQEKVDEKEVIKLLGDLVSKPSYWELPNQETAVAEHIYNFLKLEGIESEVVPVVDGRCNLIARIKGNGQGKSLMLTGHMDTVPPYDMTRDPFKIEIEDGKIYGRGVVDMKGPLACMLMAMVAIKRANIKLKGDLVFAGVIGEETKSEGTIDLLKSGIRTDAAMVGEPTELHACICHRGLEWFEIAFEGKTVHGGKQKEGINAIEKAYKFMEKVEKNVIPNLESKRHPIIGTSSMNYGKIMGGTQPSTVAGECIIQIDRRWIPGEKYKDVVEEYQSIIDNLHKEDPTFKATLKVMDESVMEDGFVHEAMETQIDDPIVNTICHITKVITGNTCKRTAFLAWSDGGLINSYGNIPTVVFGPGSLESAHSKDEHIAVNDIIPATMIYALTAIEFCNQEK